MIKILNARLKVAQKIGGEKVKGGDEIYVPAREKSVLDRVAELNGGPLPAEALQAIYREIMSAALSLEQHVKIAYLGPMATFTHQAARSKFGSTVEYIPCETIRDVYDAVEKKKASYGVVPIENSTEGAVTHTLDQFMESPLKICAEIFLSISHSLLSNEPKEKIERIYSNPQVFGQCRKWIHSNLPGVDLIPISSTARAAEKVVSEPGAGAMASKLAAELYGLNVLDSDVQDVSGNFTRFLVLGKDYGEPTGEDKTSIMFSVPHKVGALFEALSTINENKLNMTRIESRPSKTKAWEYCFFVDVEGHTSDTGVGAVLEQLKDHCTRLTVLGSYPSATMPN